MSAGLGRLPDRRLLLPVLGIVVTVILWGLGDTITASAGGLYAEQVGIAVLYTGSIFQPACWWVLAIRWAEHVGHAPASFLRASWWMPVAWAIPWWLFMLTNPWHGRLLTPVIGDRNEYTTLWWLLVASGVAVIFGACALMLQVSRRLESPRLRRHGQLTAISSLMIVVSTGAYVLFGEPFSQTALACLGASAGLLVFGMLRWGLFGVMPLALPVVFERSPDGLLVVDSEGRLLHANPRARELLAPASLAPDEFIPLALAPGLRTAQGAALPGGKPGTQEWWRQVGSEEGLLHRHASAEGTVWLHISSHSVLGRGSRVAARAVRIRDVTRETVTQVDQRRARRLESVTQLARGVVHDWNNVLASLRGNADLLRDELDGSPRLTNRVDKILRVADRAGELADQLHLYAGGAEPMREPVDLNELVVEVAEVIEPEAGPQVGLELDLTDEALEIEADPTQLRQALLNLLVNAREALSEAGGQIRVVTELGHREPSELRGLALGEVRGAGTYASVRVEDTGAGMDSELQERIFEPFFSTKGKQRGTGLATVVGVARAHEGLVQVDSEPGRGTAFTLYVPAID
jgi:signal transduction histidine kinase